jgi:hypothetical protein
MIKPIFWLYIFLILAFALAGCGLAAPTTQPTQIEQIPTPTVICDGQDLI